MQHDKGFVFHVVGANRIPPAILALNRSDGRGSVQRIVVHGHVPDLRPLYGRMRVSVAPLRWGAGVKGKVNSAHQLGVPVVGTSAAVAGSAVGARALKLLLYSLLDELVRQWPRLGVVDAAVSGARRAAPGVGADAAPPESGRARARQGYGKEPDTERKGLPKGGENEGEKKDRREGYYK